MLDNLAEKEPVSRSPIEIREGVLQSIPTMLAFLDKFIPVLEAAEAAQKSIPKPEVPELVVPEAQPQADLDIEAISQKVDAAFKEAGLENAMVEPEKVQPTKPMPIQLSDEEVEERFQKIAEIEAVVEKLATSGKS